MEYKLYDLIVQSAATGLTLQNIDGSFPKGHDGPWNNEDTFLRTTSHWALLIAKAYELTNEKKYLYAVVKACNFLINQDARPYKYTFLCRENNPSKDKCNGLIGQAWVLEALILIGRQLSEQKFLEIAKNVIQVHPYDYNKHSWSAVEIDGTVLGECTTLNQQVWFSAMVVTLGNFLHDDQLLFAGMDFFSNLHKKITFTGGVIQHSYSQAQWKVKKWGRQLLSQMNKNEHNSFQMTLSISYLTFLLYGMAFAIDNSHISLNKEFFMKAVRYIESNYPYGYLENPCSYRWSYNPVGIEMAYVLQVFNHNIESFSLDNSRWLMKQFEGYFDFEKSLLNKNTADPDILASRLYEAVRLDNYRFNLPPES